jgi:cobalt-zinc-cadmium efflux system outer membrane protein
LFRTSSATLFGVACLGGAIAAPFVYAQEQAGAALTLNDAFARALADDPGLAAAREGARGAEAYVSQAGRLANPTLDVLVENVEGSGPYRSDERAERTYSLSQPFELGGDRQARRALAEGDRAAARAGAEISRLDLLHHVQLAYIDAQAADAALAVAEQRLAVARELAEAVDRRVRAARDPLMAGSRAQARLAEAEIEAESARRTAVAGRSRLASYWGGGADYRLDAASFEQLRVLAQGASATAPDVALAQAESQRAEARLALESARRIPDPTLQAGFRAFSDTDETAMVFGFSMPLQIWDRNSGAVARARADSARAAYEVEARRRTVARESEMLRAQAETARLEVEALDARIIPHGEQALARAREGYAQGGFSYLDVLEAQRALSDARLRRIAALRTYHRAQAGLARFAGALAEPDPLRGTQP